jgi:hypothetical protein
MPSSTLQFSGAAPCVRGACDAAGNIIDIGMDGRRTVRLAAPSAPVRAVPRVQPLAPAAQDFGLVACVRERFGLSAPPQPGAKAEPVSELRQAIQDQFGGRELKAAEVQPLFSTGGF